MFAKAFQANTRKAALCLGATLVMAGCATTEPIMAATETADDSEFLVRIVPPADGGDEYSLSATGTFIPTSKIWLSRCEKWDEWDKPGPPYRIHGGTFYVGTCGISAILILGENDLAEDDRGHILIDSGTQAGADIVLANIRTLGIDPRDISVLLSSHEHFDHVGGMAKLQENTGADVFAMAPAARVLSSGRDDAADPQFGMHPAITPMRVTKVLANTEQVVLGALTVTPITTPGHTPGAMSWQWESCDDPNDGGQCKTIVYADSLSPVSSDIYRFSDHPEYVAAYRKGLDDLAEADCDILITPHPSSSKMVERMASGEGLEENGGCIAYAAHINARLDKRLDEEAQEAQIATVITDGG